jgi:iron complex outermembrane receptor protein
MVERGNDEQGVTAAAWGGTRALDNPLPFAVVTVDRRNAGAWIRASSAGRLGAFATRSSAGVDVQAVRDERRNLENCVGAATTVRCPLAGSDRGVVRLDQREVVQSEGAFVRYELGIPQRLDLSAALRWDQIRFRVTDRFVTTTDRNDSGEQGQTAITPMLGAAWRVRPALAVYANINTAFETPTVTELTTQADGSAGLNADLAPQRTRTAEVGVRGVIGTRTWVDIALFDAASRDELIPFDVPNAPGRRAFRNAGGTARRGLEASVQQRWSVLQLGAAYTASRFRFVSYAVGAQRYDGNTVPGTPSHQMQGWATLRAGSWMLTADVAAASATVVDDANTERAAAWRAVGVRAASEGIRVRGGWYAAPMIGVDNLFDARYASAVLVNATRGRYYEPAPPRTVYAGVRVGASMRPPR